jgi:CRP-like cAMP-binding protein
MNQHTEAIQKNQLLGLLPTDDRQFLEPYLVKVNLRSGHVICEPNEPMNFAYFPNTAMISVVSIMSNGSTTEIGLIGNEGMVGLPIILGGKQMLNQAIVQVSGEVYKIEATKLLWAFQNLASLQSIFLLYIQARLTQVSQTAACNSQHRIDKRLARWLLSVHDCVQVDQIPLTQEFVANMLGVRRSGVTTAAFQLQKAGLIRYQRGHITLLDIEGLKECSCECYSLVQSEYIRLLGFRRG